MNLPHIVRLPADFHFQRSILKIVKNRRYLLIIDQAIEASFLADHLVFDTLLRASFESPPFSHLSHCWFIADQRCVEAEKKW